MKRSRPRAYHQAELRTQPAARAAAREISTPNRGTPLSSVMQRAAIDPRLLTAADVAQLQRTIGNAAVSRLLARLLPRENRTGLPDRLKAGIEHLSGVAMDDVRVHYNSPKPAEVQALAFAQGTDIHVAPGQEQHLPHEAWHVVQQKQGRVESRLLANGVALNDDRALENEAERMGERALCTCSIDDAHTAGGHSLESALGHGVAVKQRGPLDLVVQRVVTPIQQPRDELCWAAVGYAVYLHKGGARFPGADVATQLDAFVAAKGSKNAYVLFKANKSADIDEIIGSQSNGNNLLEAADGKGKSGEGYGKAGLTAKLNKDPAIIANVDNQHYIILTGTGTSTGAFQVTYMEPDDATSKTADTTDDPTSKFKITHVGGYKLTVLYYLKP